MYLNVYRPSTRRVLNGHANSVVDSVFSDLFKASRDESAATTQHARADIIDKGDRFEITLEVPGVAKEDIEVTIDGTRVAIKAISKARVALQEGEKVLFTERRTAGYERSFELPSEILEDGSSAHYQDGLLTLALPKKVAAAVKRLEVK